MENAIITSSAVVDAFNSSAIDAAIAQEVNKNKKASSDNAVALFKNYIKQEHGNKPDFMLVDTVNTVIASLEASFKEAGVNQPSTYRTMKNAISRYVREGFTDLSLGRDAMKKAADAAEEARIHGAEKERQRQVAAYLAEQEAVRIAEQEAEAAKAAESAAATAAAEADRLAVLWHDLAVAVGKGKAALPLLELAIAYGVAI